MKGDGYYAIQQQLDDKRERESAELQHLRVEVVNARGDLGHAIEVIRKIVVRGGFGHWTWSLADSVLGKGESERLTREHYKRECAEET